MCGAIQSPVLVIEIEPAAAGGGVAVLVCVGVKVIDGTVVGVRVRVGVAVIVGLDVTVEKADDVKALINLLKGKHASDVVVVAAHSDAIPELLAAYGYTAVPPIAQDEYDNLFVVVPKGNGPATVLRFRY